MFFLSKFYFSEHALYSRETTLCVYPPEWMFPHVREFVFIVVADTCRNTVGPSRWGMRLCRWIQTAVAAGDAAAGWHAHALTKEARARGTKRGATGSRMKQPQSKSQLKKQTHRHGHTELVWKMSLLLRVWRQWRFTCLHEHSCNKSPQCCDILLSATCDTWPCVIRSNNQVSREWNILTSPRPNNLSVTELQR